MKVIGLKMTERDGCGGKQVKFYYTQALGEQAEDEVQ